jgi:hypothetical protein
MTDHSDPPLGFCESCGAKRIMAGQSHCASCGQKLLQLSEIALGSAPAAATAATQAAPEALAESVVPVVQAVPAATTVAPVPPPITSPIPEQPLAPPEVLAPAFAPIPPPPWVVTAPPAAATLPPAAYPPPPPSATAAYVAATGPWQPPASAPWGEVPIDAATGPAVRRRRFPLPLLIGIGVAAVVAIAGGVYFLSSSKPANPIITVSGVELKVASVQLTDSYGAGSEAVAPSSTTDTFLVVKCDVISSSVETVSWDVSVTADKGSIVTPSVTEWNSQAGQLKELAWVFVVAKTSQTFVLNFPDGQKVQLDSFVTTSGSSASP